MELVIKTRSAFQKVKQELTSLPILAKYDMSLLVGLACDAIEKGLGVCLLQVTAGKEHTVAYASKSLTKAERNYSQIELEALSIIFGTRKFQHFLLGRKFVLRTGHRPLLTVFDPTKLTTPTRTSRQLARWALQLSQYDYQIQYWRSVELGNADCLSRLPIGHDEDFEQTNEYQDQSE